MLHYAKWPLEQDVGLHVDDDQFHQQIFALLGYTLTSSTQALALLAEIEKQYHVSIPAAVRGWLALEHVHVLLEQFSPDRHGAVALEAYLQLPNDESNHRLHDLLTNGWFAFLMECQGIGYWAVPVTVSPDPPVVFIDDAAMLDMIQPIATEPFSRFMVRWFSEGSTFVKPSDWPAILAFGICLAWAKTTNVMPSEIALLKQIDPALRRGQHLYRVQYKDKILIIEDDPQNKRAQWYVVGYFDVDVSYDGIEAAVDAIHGRKMSKEQLLHYFQR